MKIKDSIIHDVLKNSAVTDDVRTIGFESFNGSIKVSGEVVNEDKFVINLGTTKFFGEFSDSDKLKSLSMDQKKKFVEFLVDLIFSDVESLSFKFDNDLDKTVKKDIDNSGLYWSRQFR